MLCVCSFHPGDSDQALRLAGWIDELGGCKGHELILINDARCQGQIADQVYSIFRRSFDTVERLSFADHFRSWPAAPNAVFAFAARHIMATNPRPWLNLEPDCVPIKAGWLDALDAEYQSARSDGKFFLGDFVSVPTVPDHCSGVAVYPGNLIEHAGIALISSELAWDVSAAEQILPQMKRSALIHHCWKHEPFADWSAFETEVLAFKPECVLFHADKSGSLFPILRERMNLSVPVLADAVWNTDLVAPGGIARESTKPAGGSNAEVTDNSRGAQFTFDILIKSHQPDYERLGYCLRSIKKFASGFRSVIIVVDVELPATPIHELAGWDAEGGNSGVLVYPVQGNDGYLWQQCIKASAHEYTDADYVLHLDSDCLLTQPVTPQTFMRDGKPIWYMTPYSATETPWKAVTEKFLGEPVEFEFMRRFPFLIPRSLHLAIGAFAMAHHKMRLTDYILSQPYREFSEFNSLGAFAYPRAREDFHWIDTTREELPPPVVIQEFSHGEFTAERKAEFEEILSEGSSVARIEGSAPENETSDAGSIPAPPNPESAAKIEGNTVTGTVGAFAIMAEMPSCIPWQSKPESLEEIRRLAERLKIFCTAPGYTKQVRAQLFKAGVVSKRQR